MRIRIHLFLFCFLASFTLVNAQNSDHPYKFGFGTHLIDYRLDGQTYLRDLVDTGDLQSGFGVSRYTFGASLNRSFSIDASVSATGINPNKLSNTESSLLWVDGDISLQYHLANGYILKENSCFAPYIFGGVGYNYLEALKMDATTGFPEGKLGLGFDIWFTPLFGINAQTGLTTQFNEDGRNYAHHSLGMVIRFGKGEDSDGDGIANWEDTCPEKAGLLKFNGCPDSDFDDITDAEDACPNNAGLPEFNGCPDTDRDGLADKDDACPNEKGLAAFNGCPDTDADGIADKDDRCPKDKGKTEFKGCPDTDSDGIADLDDACKNEKGLAKFNGCPDSDGDGLADKDDRCPKDRGDLALKGCPDADGDGIADMDDSCPDKAGVKATNGCPVIAEEIKKEIVAKVNFAAKSIQFETGSDVIKKSSYTTLDNIVSIMKLYPTTFWSIEGHTDNVGDDKMNQELSDKRAASVKKYFTDKGVEANRTTSAGFGETTPIADNKTATGRAQNRRVEIKMQ